MLTKAQRLANKKLTDQWKEPHEMGVQSDTCNALVAKGYAKKNGNKYRKVQ